MMTQKNNNQILIRKLSAEERPAALDLAWRVFSEYESPDYAKEGTEEFIKTLHDEEYLAGIAYYGAFDEESLVGLLAIRPDRKHICFFFVDGNYHRRGIGTRLFQTIRQEYPDQTITLNSSPYGVPFYHALGFRDTDKEQTMNGIRFTPMKYEGEKMTLIELDDADLPQMAELYREAFSGEPWNDDWRDTQQLYEYIKDITKSYSSLNYGLRADGKLVGMSIGKISHWWEGTNYNIEELCISPAYQRQGLGSRFLHMIENRVREKGLAGIFLQTDSDKPSYRFYHKNGFHDLDKHVSLYKSVKVSEDSAKQGKNT